MTPPSVGLPDPRAPLYLTGFGPFPGVAVNPTAAVARMLDGADIHGRRVVADVLPVAWQAAATHVAAAVARLRPQAIVHLGVAVGARALRVEQNACNRLAFRVADVTGAQPQGEPCDAGLPPDATLATRFDAAALVLALQAAGLDAALSVDAGAYVCNATYFASLRRQGQGGPPVVFLHVPELGAGWGLGHLATAARVVLGVVAHGQQAAISRQGA